MCNCNKNKSAARPRTLAGATGTSGTATQSFALLKRDGSRETFGSRLEADAANARAGYTGIVKPV